MVNLDQSGYANIPAVPCHWHEQGYHKLHSGPPLQKNPNNKGQMVIKIPFAAFDQIQNSYH
jgi:hypothetical protein